MPDPILQQVLRERQQNHAPRTLLDLVSPTTPSTEETYSMPAAAGINIFSPEWKAVLAEANAALDTRLPKLSQAMQPKPFYTTTRQPKVGGVLDQVVERAHLKHSTGEALTPGEDGLLRHFLGLIR